MLERFAQIISQDGKTKGTIEDDLKDHLTMRDKKLIDLVAFHIRDEIDNNAHDDGETVNVDWCAELCTKLGAVEYWKDEIKDLNDDMGEIIKELDDQLDEVYLIAENFQDNAGGAVNDIGERAAYLESYGTQEEKDEFISKIATWTKLGDLQL